MRGCLSVVLLVFGVGSLIGGIVLVVKGKGELEESKVVSTWPTAQGVVKSTHVAERTGSVRTVRVPRKSGSGYTSGKVTEKVYAPRIVYSFSVAGSDFTGNDWGPGDESWTSEASAKAELKRTPVGSAVKVWYNPANPADSYLDPGEILSTVMIFVGGGMAVMGAVLALLALLIRRGGRKPPPLPT